MIDELSPPQATRVEVLIPKPVYRGARIRAVAQYLKVAHIAREVLYSAARWAVEQPELDEETKIERFPWRATGARSTQHGDTSRVRFNGAAGAVRVATDSVRDAGYSMALVLTSGLDYYGRTGVIPNSDDWPLLLSEQSLTDLTNRVEAAYSEGKPDNATEDPQGGAGSE